jgi:hypothetical protein
LLDEIKAMHMTRNSNSEAFIMLDGEILIEAGDERRVGDFVHDLNDVSRDAGSRPDRAARVAPAAGTGSTSLARA